MEKIINKLPPKILKELYWDKNMSSSKIAKTYECSRSTITRRLKEYGIKLRTRSEANRVRHNINISKKELKKLYLEKKISSNKIAKKFNCNPGLIIDRLREYKIRVRSIQEALPLSNKPKYPQYDFSGNLETKAYLIGFRRGDLYVYERSKNSSSVFISVASTKPALINLVKQSFSPYGHIQKGKPDKRGVVHIHCSLNRTFNFLLAKKDLIEPWIIRNKNYFFAFLAGYSDAEGSFCLCRGNGVFSIRSQDKNILHQIRSKLIEFNILLRPPQIARKKGTLDNQGTISNEDIWGIWIHRKDALLKLIELLRAYSKHSDKEKEMSVVENNILWRNAKYDHHQTSKHDKLYLKEGIYI